MPFVTGALPGITPGLFSILGAGAARGRTVLTSEALAREFGVTTDWVTQRTGISTRRIADVNETSLTLAVDAARAALAAADAREIDLVICATYTPERQLCPMAPSVAARLGLERPGAFDLNAACSGSVTGLLTACACLSAGMAREILLVASDTTTKHLAPGDLNTRSLFGDGAAAVVLARAARPRFRVRSHSLGSDGSCADWFSVPPAAADAAADAAAGAAADAAAAAVAGTVVMDGPSLFRFAVEHGAELITTLCEQAACAPGEVDRVIAHQANVRILAALERQVGIPADRWPSNLAHTGNTASGSALLLFAEEFASRPPQSGERWLLVGFGAGLAWSGAMVEWD